MTRHVLLIDHGTRLMELQPGSIAHAAEHDLKMREGKRKVRDGFGRVTSAPVVEAGARYCFHRKHVKLAASPADLLARAIMEPGLGKASAKVNTRIVYGDVEKLKLALEIARERYG
jgi:hypothetical protein